MKKIYSLVAAGTDISHGVFHTFNLAKCINDKRAEGFRRLECTLDKKVVGTIDEEGLFDLIQSTHIVKYLTCSYTLDFGHNEC